MLVNIYGHLFLKRISFLFFSLLLVSSITGNKKNSLSLSKIDKTIEYNSDTIFSNYAANGFQAVINDLYEYYEDVLFRLPKEKQNTEIEKMRIIAKTKDSKALEEEANLISALCLPESNEIEIRQKATLLKELAEKAAKNNNSLIEIRSMDAVFSLYWRSMEYAKAFHEIHLIERRLEEIKENICLCRNEIYFKMGEAYFFFRDYNKAIPYLRKAIGPAQHFCDRSNIQALNLMGSFFNIKGEIDSAQYYFREAYNSYEKVKSRSMLDAVSLSNLGHTFVKQGKYDEAIPYFRAGLSYMLANADYERASDATLGLANCYLAKRNMGRTKQLIDSTSLFIKRSGNDNLNRSLYPLMSKYFSKNGNMKQVEAYLDSAVVVNERYLERYNNLHVLRAEQEVFEAESAAKDDKLRHQQEMYNNRLVYGGVIIVLISLAFIFLSVLYRKNRKAYRILVQKNQDWAKTETVYRSIEPAISSAISKESTNEPDSEDMELMQEVDKLIKQDKIFNELDLTLDSLAKRLDVNRNYLSKAVNKTTGKNFNTYINEYRIKEAIKIMSDEQSNLISIDAIALEVGFGNRTSFYQSFKKITGLSPSDFRNNKIKEEDIEEEANIN